MSTVEVYIQAYDKLSVLQHNLEHLLFFLTGALLAVIIAIIIKQELKGEK